MVALTSGASSTSPVSRCTGSSSSLAAKPCATSTSTPRHTPSPSSAISGVMPPASGSRIAPRLWTQRGPCDDGLSPIKWLDAQEASLRHRAVGLVRLRETRRHASIASLMPGLTGYLVSLAALTGAESIDDTVRLIGGHLRGVRGHQSHTLCGAGRPAHGGVRCTILTAHRPRRIDPRRRGAWSWIRPTVRSERSV